MITPYYSDDTVILYLGDCREVLPALDIRPDCVVADPPYGETSLAWDRWPDGWPQTMAGSAGSMWCFGSLRMFLERRDEFDCWKLSHDSIGEFDIDTAVWEKHNGTGFTTDRLRKVHELVAHWYRGPWSAVYHEVPRQPAKFDAKGRTTSARYADRAAHTGSIAGAPYVDDGLRLVRSVVRIPSVRGGVLRAQKPDVLLDPYIEYACPPGGLVLDPFAGSGSTAVAARRLHRRTVLIELDEQHCEAIVKRLQQDVLPIAEVGS